VGGGGAFIDGGAGAGVALKEGKFKLGGAVGPEREGTLNDGGGATAGEGAL
jgi:hypothetical protein